MIDILHTIAIWFLLFITYAFLGWLMEMIITVVIRHRFYNRGFFDWAALSDLWRSWSSNYYYDWAPREHFGNFLCSNDFWRGNRIFNKLSYGKTVPCAMVGLYRPAL